MINTQNKQPRLEKLLATLPHFAQIDLEHIEQELTSLLKENQMECQKLLGQNGPYNWDNLIQPLEALNDKLHNFWSPITHLHSVSSNDKLRAVYHACLPILTEYYTALHHNNELFSAVNSIANSAEFSQLNPAQKMVIKHQLRDFKLAGVALPPEQKQRYLEISKKLSHLCSTFEEHVLDATQGWQKTINNEKELEGLPPLIMESVKNNAERLKVTGWVLTLDFPIYMSVMKYAKSRKLREEMYYAYATRASDQGPNGGRWDNSAVMQDILLYRHELAKLLGFNNYAELSLATKMAKTPSEVKAFLQQLIDASHEKSLQEFQELTQFAKTVDAINSLEAWDVAYYSEKLRQSQYSISQETLRPYFPVQNVLKGLFEITQKLFQIRIEPLSGVEVWDPAVLCFAIYDQYNQIISAFYLDLFTRSNKRGGAWMDDCRSRRIQSNGSIQIPVGYIVCNFNPPHGSEPALLTHDDVVTLFHEFGHGLQHMLTKIDYADVSGINGVPWDAVEIASQFFEDFAWEQDSISYIAKHFKTHETIPATLFENLKKSKNFQAAMQMMRQLEFALFDFRLHQEFDPKKENFTQTILDEVRAQTSVYAVPSYNRFQHGFSHIFAGGYAAGYYSYKWAEVLAADAFSLFKEKGIFDPTTSQKFLTTFLQSGGAVEPMELFIEFRGRKPKIDALLEQLDISSSR